MDSSGWPAPLCDLSSSREICRSRGSWNSWGSDKLHAWVTAPGAAAAAPGCLPALLSPPPGAPHLAPEPAQQLHLDLHPLGRVGAGGGVVVLAGLVKLGGGVGRRWLGERPAPTQQPAPASSQGWPASCAAHVPAHLRGVWMRCLHNLQTAQVGGHEMGAGHVSLISGPRSLRAARLAPAPNCKPTSAAHLYKPHDARGLGIAVIEKRLVANAHRLWWENLALRLTRTD